MSRDYWLTYIFRCANSKFFVMASTVSPASGRACRQSRRYILKTKPRPTDWLIGALVFKERHHYVDESPRDGKLSALATATDDTDVASLAALGSRCLFEGDGLTLGQRLEAVTLDAREVDE
jgi:hypothetical protein